jgi:hypothetical protein
MNADTKKETNSYWVQKLASASFKAKRDVTFSGFKTNLREPLQSQPRAILRQSHARICLKDQLKPKNIYISYFETLCHRYIDYSG